jgi:putative spermidine/putrescine transport system substrate-binding protein
MERRQFLMERRQFLRALGLLSLEPLLFGCQQAPPNQLQVKLLRGTFPGVLLGEFRRFSKSDLLEVSAFGQLAEGLKLLKEWKNPPAPTGGWSWRLPWQAPPNYQATNLISLGDAWLQGAIEQKLLQPLDIGKLPSWQKLATQWQKLGSSDGQIWGAPYRWGSTVLIYRKDRLQQNNIPLPTDWSDLWQPGLKGKVVLLNQQQEVIGLTLKHLGHSYSTDPQQVPELLPALRQLHQQTLFYSSDRYISPLLTGDAWVAVGWSADVVGLLTRQPDLGIAVPASGASLWADLWVQPNTAKSLPSSSPSIGQWIDFCWQNAAATKISTSTNGASPVFSSQPLPPGLPENPLYKAFAKGEFLPSLNTAQQQQYQKLWQDMRS